MSKPLLPAYTDGRQYTQISPPSSSTTLARRNSQTSVASSISAAVHDRLHPTERRERSRSPSGGSSLGHNFGPYSYENVDPRSSRGSLNSQLDTVPLISKSPGDKNGRNMHYEAKPIVYTLWNDKDDIDDALHRPDIADRHSTFWSSRGFVNLGTLAFLLLALFALFLGYPIIHTYTTHKSTVPGFNLGGLNGTGVLPSFPSLRKNVDADTPAEAGSRVGSDGNTYNLVFSDEFNVDNRTFYPGDDPFWEAQNMHYWATGDFEWYDPKTITTHDGKLVISLSEVANHNLNFQSGMLTSWNKFCFTTGYVEVSVSLPGAGNVPGLWPGAWSMGNLGRAGYGATTDGLWPYSYDACDTGTFPQQVDKNGNPQTSASGPLSNLPGQRLSACTCPGSDHPGPNVKTGRGAPEIDIIEAQVNVSLFQGAVSQSFQVAPFNANLQYDQTEPATTIHTPNVTIFNSFMGTDLQQSLSAVSLIDNANYNNNAYATYGYEWWSDPNDRKNSYITWYSEGIESWTLTGASIGPDTTSEVDQRLISEEPMYLILNLGLAPSFQQQDWKHLKFPSRMYIDYVRVYQREGVGADGSTCDPPSHPTADYIANHPQAYTNPNWTTWDSAGYSTPRNSKYDDC